MLRFVVMLVLFAGATYLLVRVIQERGLTPPPSGRGPQRRPLRPQPPRVVAPDDDEEFLRDLDRKRLNPEDPGDRGD